MNPLNNRAYTSLEHSQSFFKDHFVINWTFFNICNFSCSYCIPALYNGTVKGVELDVALRFVDKIFEAKKDKKIFFEFTGGEITFYQHFRELFTYIKDRGGYTGIISNGTRTVEWWKEHVHLIDHACLSFHSEKGKSEHFYNVVSTVNGKLTLHVNIMMLPEKFDEVLNLGSRIASTVEGVSVSLQPLFERFSGPMFSYTPEQLEILKDPKLSFGSNILFPLPAGFQHKVYRGQMKKVNRDGSSEIADPTLLISNQENSWLGWDCLAGVENLVVRMDGSVTRGICQMGGLVGRIQDPDFKLPTESVLCLKKRCNCAFDIMSTKTR
jgi:organic radical activating enzyme